MGRIKITLPSVTLDEAREEMLAHAEEGTRCPCCGRYIKVYKRKLTGTMAEILVNLVRVHGGGNGETWTHVRKIPLRGADARVAGGDLGKLALWGLVVEQINEDPEKGRSGYWRPTVKGVDFVRGRCAVPTHVFVYQNTVQGYSRRGIHVWHALGRTFNYDELMSQ
jgi:hypothetical protein